MIDGKIAVAIVGCGGMGGGHAVAIATGSGQALWMTDGSRGRELEPGDTRSGRYKIPVKTVTAGINMYIGGYTRKSLENDVSFLACMKS